MITKFRLGLIGAGRMGQTHLRALAGSERVEIVAIAEPSAANRAELPLPAHCLHADVDALLTAGGLDGILIATPSPSHVEVVKRVASARLPILCEKPCGISASEAKRAAAVAERADVRLQVAYWRRFVPELRQFKDRIAAGELGALYLVSCFQWDETPPAAAFRSGSGGPFIDMGVHEFDQLRWLTGQELGNFRVARSSTVFDANIPEDPDAVQILCDLSNGATGMISLGRRFPIGDACWAQAFGTKGFEDCRFLWPPKGEQVFLEALRRQIEDFADAVRGKPSQGATAADAVAALTAAEQAAADV